MYDSSNYNFGSLASIRKQAYAIGDREKAEIEARRAEEDRTGLIENRGANMSKGSYGGMIFLLAALDKAYSQHMKGGTTSKLDI